MSTKTDTILPSVLIHLMGGTILGLLLFIAAGLTSFHPTAWKLGWLALASLMGGFGWWELAKRNNCPDKGDKCYLLTVAAVLVVTLAISLLPSSPNHYDLGKKSAHLAV